MCGLYVDVDASGGYRASGAIEGMLVMGVFGMCKGDGMLDMFVVCVDGMFVFCIGMYLLCKFDVMMLDGESIVGDV